ncbi:hypothetical protein V8B97DRAFT_2026852 [Scleroderma yunnanense]
MQLEDALGSKEAGIDSEQEAHFILNYPPSRHGELLIHPTVVLGNDGTIAVWYLPNALSCPTEVLFVVLLLPFHLYFQDTTLRSLLPLQEQLASSIDDRLVGCLEFTPTSQIQGHTTCFFNPTISTDLNTEATFQWGRNMATPNSIISGALSIMLLQIYNMEQHPHMHEALSIWPIAFTNISAITNSVGNYKDCVPHIPSLGINLMYGPGIVVAFLGHLLQHGVNSVEGNRYCLTYYMRDNIHNFVCVARCDWMRMENVELLLLPTVNQDL